MKRYFKKRKENKENNSFFKKFSVSLRKCWAYAGDNDRYLAYPHYLLPFPEFTYECMYVMNAILLVFLKFQTTFARPTPSVISPVSNTNERNAEETPAAGREDQAFYSNFRNAENDPFSDIASE